MVAMSWEFDWWLEEMKDLRGVLAKDCADDELREELVADAADEQMLCVSGRSAKPPLVALPLCSSES